MPYDRLKRIARNRKILALKGKPLREIAKKFKMSIANVSYVIKNFQDLGTYGTAYSSVNRIAVRCGCGNEINRNPKLKNWRCVECKMKKIYWK